MADLNRPPQPDDPNYAQWLYQFWLSQRSYLGTVTSVSVANANGFDGTVLTPSSTPAITLKTTVTGLLKGNGTAISAATPSTDYTVPADFASASVLNATKWDNAAKTVSTSTPSGGSDGDIWFQYTP